MTKAIWAPRARAELRAIAAYLRLRNPTAATRLSAELFAIADQLVRFPGLGRPSNIPNHRERSVPDWHVILLYRVTEGSIEISALRDTRRKPTEFVEE